LDKNLNHFTDTLNATSEYRFVFLYRLRITIFQTSRPILFKTNICHHGEPVEVESPGQLPSLIWPGFPTLSKRAFQVIIPFQNNYQGSPQWWPWNKTSISIDYQGWHECISFNHCI